MKKLSLILVLATNFAFAQFQTMKQKNKPNGYPGLNRFGKIDTNQLPPVKAPILPAMVNSFNGRAGDVTLNNNDISTALGGQPLMQVTWNNVQSKPTTFPADWNTTINKPQIPNVSSYYPKWELEPRLGLFWITTLSDVEQTGRWTKVCYGLDKFVAVSDSGTRLMYSYDGYYWVAGTLPTEMATAEFTSITYGNGLFVAVALANTSGTGQRIMTSTDGINWTGRNQSSTFALKDVCFGNGKFVIVGAWTSPATQIMSSTDGINWVSTTLSGNTFSYAAVAYGMGKFVAASDSYTGNNAILESVDNAVTWQTRTHTNFTSSQPYKYVCYADGSFYIKTGKLNSNPHIITQNAPNTDYTRWIGSLTQATGAMAYGMGSMVAVGESPFNSGLAAISFNYASFSGWIKFSTSTWQTITVNSTSLNTTPNHLTGMWSSVCYGNGKFVAVAYTNIANGGTNHKRAMVSGGFNN